MIPLSSILRANDTARYANGVDQNLGDHYLCFHNEFYRSLREASVAGGVRFVSSTTPLGQAYQGFPLLMLDQMLEAREVPVHDNVAPIRAWLARQPNATAAPTRLVEMIHRNNAFHESAHIVANIALCEESPPANKNQFVLNSLSGEAFAHSSWYLLEPFLASKPAILFSLFAGTNYDPDASDALRRMIGHLGLRNTVALCIQIYGFTLVAGSVPPDGQTYRALKSHVFAGKEFDGAASEDADRVMRSLTVVNEQFRTETQKFYFELHGAGDEFDRLCGFAQDFRNHQFVLGEFAARAAIVARRLCRNDAGVQ